ncbi:MAG: RibD family protein, partial [Bacteroidota bacterium]
MIWNTLLNIKKSICDWMASYLPGSYVTSQEGLRITISQSDNEPPVFIKIENVNAGNDVVFSADKPFELKLVSNSLLGEEDLTLTTLYLPYALLSYFGRLNKTCYAVTHFAQTLDGRIASASGDSKWIGNDENLIHAHRMRALCDSIMVGANTVKIDNPRLNVRLVNGENPIKVVIGGKDIDRSEFHAYDDTSIVFCENGFSGNGQSDNTLYKPEEMLMKLHEKGCYSVYIEGGSNTSSLFYKDRCIDQVQIH